MIVVHPIDHPLFKAMFDGTITPSVCSDKRDELKRRHISGEPLDKLVKEARTFVAEAKVKARKAMETVNFGGKK